MEVRRRAHRLLSDVKVRQAKGSAKLHDGGGLYFEVNDRNSGRWVLRLTINGKRTRRGLGIVRETERAFGLPVNPHLFRDCAATSIAIDDPTSVRMAASVLGHAGFGSTEKYYNLATGLEAGRAYSSVLCARRSGTKR